jgi:hypothetical protein
MATYSLSRFEKIKVFEAFFLSFVPRRPAVSGRVLPLAKPLPSPAARLGTKSASRLRLFALLWRVDKIKDPFTFVNGVVMKGDASLR